MTLNIASSTEVNSSVQKNPSLSFNQIKIEDSVRISEVVDSEILKSPAMAAAANPIITEAPKGKALTYILDSYGWELDRSGHTFRHASDRAAIVIEGDDGFYYFYNIFSGYATDSYLKGIREGDNIIVPLPQEIMKDYVEGYEEHVQHIAIMNAKNGGSDYTLSKEEEVVFNIGEDGTITLDLGYDTTLNENGNLNKPEKILGLTTPKGLWLYVGEAKFTMTPYSPESTILPNGVDTEQWAILSSERGRFVNVGFKDDDVYLQGIVDNEDPICVKGKLEDDKVIFPSRQFMGIESGYFTYFSGASCQNDEWTLTDQIVFNYNKENKVMTCGPDDVLLVNTAIDKIYCLEYYPQARIKNQAYINPTPQAPIINEHIDMFTSYGFVYFSFSLSDISIDGDLLNTGNMYYSIFIDGNIETLYADDYINLPVEEMTKIPYNFHDGYDFDYYNGDHLLYLQVTGYKTIGVQLFNEYNGKVYSSDTSIYDVDTETWWTTGVEKTTSSTVINEEYLTIEGIKTSNPSGGIFIRKQEMEDGSIKLTKVMMGI